MIYFIFSKVPVLKTGYSYDKVSCVAAYDTKNDADNICDTLNKAQYEKVFYDAVSLRYKMLYGLSKIDYTYYNNIYDVEYFVTIGGYEFQDILEIERERDVILSKKWLDETINMYKHNVESYYVIEMRLNECDLLNLKPLN